MTRFSTILSAISLLLLTPTVLAAIPDPSGAKNVGNGIGAQFIPGGCVSDADCASGCCAELAASPGVGVCSGPAVGNVSGKLGCGFVDGNASAMIENARAQV